MMDDGWADDVLTKINADTSSECQLISGLLKKCRALALMVKRSTRIANFFDRLRTEPRLCCTLRADIRT
jgi:hypothetical protein